MTGSGDVEQRADDIDGDHHRDHGEHEQYDQAFARPACELLMLEEVHRTSAEESGNGIRQQVRAATASARRARTAASNTQNWTLMAFFSSGASVACSSSACLNAKKLAITLDGNCSTAVLNAITASLNAWRAKEILFSVPVSSSESCIMFALAFRSG